MNKRRYKNINVLVVGDTCVDKFVYGHVHRLAPDGPIPIFSPEYVKTNPGMSGNVTENVKSLGANAFHICNKEEIIKTRYVDDRSGYILIRIDENDKVNRIDQDILHEIKNNIFKDIKFNTLLISDYAKGFLNEEDIQFLLENNSNTYLDSKKILDSWCSKATFIKINHVEYEHTKYNLKELNIDDKLIITKSSDGCLYNGKLFPIDGEINSIKDVSGAGDTFLSGFSLEYTKSSNVDRAIEVAQEVASIVIKKRGVETV